MLNHLIGTTANNYHNEANRQWYNLLGTGRIDAATALAPDDPDPFNGTGENPDFSDDYESVPSLRYARVEVVDDPGVPPNNGNGIAEAGEIVELIVHLVNWYGPTGPVDVTIYDHAQTEPFVRNMYGQAAFLMQDLRHTMGDPAFFAFLQDYYASNAGKIVSADDFFATARRHTDANLAGLLNGYFRDPDH